jgi:hypothetical protein
MPPTRREFLMRLCGAGAALAAVPRVAKAQPLPTMPSAGVAELPLEITQACATLRSRFPDLRRRFLFEYYPWYGRDPWRHWEQWGRRPPDDLASNYFPRLGAYDSRDLRVLEQHARWIADSGAGGVNVSWWGGGSFEDRAAHTLFDVLRAHDLRATFHLEPYRYDRALWLAEDILYLLRVFGEGRRYDVLLLLSDAAGQGPVFKTFHTILPRRLPHCRGGSRPVPEYASDAEWRRQTDTIRELLRRDFSRLTLLADSLHFPRTRASGFDGIAIYDNRVGPERYPQIAAEASRRDLLFSLNVNPGFDTIAPRRFSSKDCFTFPSFVPATEPPIDWDTPEGRERAAFLSRQRIDETFAATLRAQADPASSNARQGFFLVYLNSFNEWHEGHQFEPMKDAAEMSPAESAVRYGNPGRGDGRLERLRELLAAACTPSTPSVGDGSPLSSFSGLGGRCRGRNATPVRAD